MEKNSERRRAAVLCVCLNPTLQKTLVFGRIRRGEVNRALEERVDASGKGVNVARVLAETGRRSIHLTQAGGPTRDWFLSLCAADGLELRWAESGSEIRFCHSLIDRSEGGVTELVEESRPVGEGCAARIEALFREALPECGALVISGSRAPGFPDSLFPAMVREARRAGLLVLLDLRGRDLLACLPEGPDLVKPNLAELLATAPMPDATEAAAGAAPAGRGGHDALRDHVAAVAADWESRYGTGLVVTRGAEPTWYRQGGSLREAPVEAVAALNPTGSGDAFAAGLVAVLLEGGGLSEAVAEGTRLGGLNAARLKPGSVRD